MNGILVDSNVLLDISTEDSDWVEWSAETLARVASQASLCINSVIYAEVSVRYETMQEVDAVLPETAFRRLPIPMEAAFLAGKVYLRYRKAGGTRTPPISDFFIGAHAAVTQMRLLTRDPRRYRTYFPTVELIAPSQQESNSTSQEHPPDEVQP